MAWDVGWNATVRRGWAVAADVVRTARSHLLTGLVTFVVGFLGAFYALRLYVWAWLRGITESRMDAATAAQHEIVVQTPFEVVLLQAKLGTIAGAAVAIPVLLYRSRRELRARGYWPRVPIARPKLAAVGFASALLFAGGVAYGYLLFIPFLLGFLATNALRAGVVPHWDLVLWAEFVIVLTVSFGIAAQLPLVMCTLAYADVVPYETFRDKWRHAVLGIFVFGAVFSPPDPLSQFMWAIPLTLLYGLSLALTKFVVGFKREPAGDGPRDVSPVRRESERPEDRATEAEGGAAADRFADAAARALSTLRAGRDEDDVGGYAYDLYAVASALRSRALRLLAVFTVAVVATFTVLYEGGMETIKEEFLAGLPAAIPPDEVGVVALHPVDLLLFEITVSTLAGTLITLPLAAYYAWPTLRERELVRARRAAIATWVAALIVAFAVGTYVGYRVVAPALISYLVADALRAGLIVTYRISDAAWLVVYTTVGVGALACIPAGMWVGHRTGLVSYRALRANWREAAIGVFVLSAFVTPGGVLSMFLVAIPVLFAYGIGLGGLWLATLGGRDRGPGR